MINLILLNIFVSTFMLSLILITQIVNYPLFLKVNFSNLETYHSDYVKRISLIVMPFMMLELLVALLLLIYLESLQSIFSIILLIAIFLSTYFIQVPIHSKITNNTNTLILKKLINTNWLRTIPWFLKCIISFNILLMEVL